MSSNLVKKMAIHHLFLLFGTLGILPFFVLPSLSLAVAALANQDAVVRISASWYSPHSSWRTPAHKNIKAQGQSPLPCALSVGLLALSMGLNSSKTNKTQTHIKMLC